MDEPYRSGILGVGSDQHIYWECHGNPDGKPAIYLHRGPGSGLSRRTRRMFNLDAYRVAMFEQRGCGRSRPLANAADADLASNTIHGLIADIELLRGQLGVDRWTILGLSWGATLGLAYA
jgi:proline iminopeptidase